jgi:cytochrome c biogenesis protein CcmG/thiol:disulfide interchange protein DsbE
MNAIRAAIIVVSLSASLVLALSGQDQKIPVAAAKAPDFSLTTINGKQVKLSDYKGKVVLLDFWATWCVPCQAEIPRFAEFQKKHGQQGFQVIGISMDDSPAPVRSFYTKFDLNYPVALGTKKVAESYGGILGLPVTFLIDRDGYIVKQYEGEANLDEMQAELAKLLAKPR